MSEKHIDSILVDNLIRFTQPQELNDPFEIRPHIENIASNTFLEDYFKNNIREEMHELYSTYNKDVSKELIHQDLIRSLGTPQNKKIFMNDFYKAVSQSMGILSLTSKNNNLLMWAHYANSHKGFVIEFDPINEFFNQVNDSKEFYGRLKEVKYTNTRPNIEYFNSVGERYFFDTFLTKSEDWIYEEEYRMLMPLTEATQTIEDKIFLYKFPKQAISSIYLGANMTDENKNKIKELVNIPENKHIKIFQARVAEKTFELEFTEIQ
jgi:hypothetical protein